MSKILFIDGFAIIKVWAAGFFGFHMNGIIHILLALAVFAVLTGILVNKSLRQNNKLKLRKS